MLIFTANVKEFFFDRTKVLREIADGTSKMLSHFGGYVRKTARNSIRIRKRASRPGEPPSSHSGLLRDRIFFAYDPETKGVVIGPEATSQVFFNGDGKPVSGTIPQVLEEGGDISVFEVQDSRGGWQHVDGRSRRRIAGHKTRLRKVHIDARPYMNPAFEITKQKLPEIWADSIR